MTQNEFNTGQGKYIILNDGKVNDIQAAIELGIENGKIIKIGKIDEEAKEFFDFKASEIEVLIHPQSLVHAIAYFCDGGMKAHIGPPDMRHAIAYALYEEKRFNLS